ncbi:unnamed protein product [Callosobruchus maculatus]|uniref:Uncharacterized protein n=1 Tax=Callosobruchus maculatus TaxID=64391 RepID=A0A653BQL1_CALMS|nr:unnamed protein product [Callosobruchus maculatus]
MRELIPVPQGSMNDLLLNVGPRNVAFNVSNGYYGYQSHAHFPDRDRSNNNQAPVKMEVQQVNSQEHVQIEIQNAFWRDLDPYLNRKRQRDVAEDLGTAKRRKESSSDYHEPLFFSKPPVVQNTGHLRNPTHNVPDLPRCSMGQYF